MEQITIGFSKPQNRSFPIASWLVRWYQKTEYSHVFLKFSSETLNREIIYEAVGQGIRFVGNNEWKVYAKEIKSYTIDVQRCNYITIMQYCIDHAGMEYGYLQNIGIVLADWLGLKKNPFKSGKNCSELLADILRVEGYFLDKEVNLITPKDIDELLQRGKNGTI